ncbi:MAG: acetyl/propionyl/methylcrotonyl-CoA carboxylase subunit alpha [Pseudomonadota bacterium]
MIKTLLIANRGEIACRVMRTASRLGTRTVAVYSDADANAPHVKLADEAVHIGAAPARESYLRADIILDAARRTGADAIHPGYGFLSENADFARACAEAGIIFVGPSADAIEAMGLKDRAKALMEKAGVPVTPGYHGDNQEPNYLAQQAEKIGYPVLIKAVAGGGGKGMRLVERPDSFGDALASCQREAAASFGDERVLLERFITSPRHIEVQVFGDAHGRVIHLFERDCTLQRRHQKVLEEAPAPGMTPEVRAAMCSAAVRAALAVDYVGAGTVEFIVDGSGPLRDDGFFFMEMNTRLQVEHPVTEEITGLDLVELQLKVAAGGSLPPQDQIAVRGHAIEARLYAEDPQSGFLPSTGVLERLELPMRRVRVDSGVEQGGEVTLHYDPMIAKLIAHADTRAGAIAALSAALREDTRVWPVKTNAAFLDRALTHPGFAEFAADTSFIARHQDQLVPEAVADPLLILGALARMRGGPFANDASDPWDVANGFRLNAASVGEVGFDFDGDRVGVRLTANDVGAIQAHVEDRAYSVESGLCAGDQVSASIDGAPWKGVFERRGEDILLFSRGEARQLDAYNPEAAADALDAGAVVRAPMPGKVLSVSIEPGAAVSRGDTLLVLEAMKMEHALAAPRDGVVETVSITAGAQVNDGDVLVTLTDEESEAPAA